LSAVEIFVKDLGIVLETGKEIHFPLPLSAAAHQLFLMAAAAGLGQEDDAAVVKVFEQLANINVSRKP
jgi:L-threonate 2-dehydrogenase